MLVPVLSAALSIGLALVGTARDRATACSAEELAAAQALVPPPGTTVELKPTYSGHCEAKSRMSLSNEAILEHYQAEFTRLGWQQTPDPTLGPVGIVGESRDRISVAVLIRTGDEGGPVAAQREKDVVIFVSDAGR